MQYLAFLREFLLTAYFLVYVPYLTVSLIAFYFVLKTLDILNSLMEQVWKLYTSPRFVVVIAICLWLSWTIPLHVATWTPRSVSLGVR